MPKFLHGYESNHGPIFVFSSKATMPLSKGGTIKVEEWMGKAPVEAATRLEKALKAKEFDIKEVTKTVRGPAEKLALADHVRYMASKLDQE